MTVYVLLFMTYTLLLTARTNKDRKDCAIIEKTKAK